jgi:hypothetical protein
MPIAIDSPIAFGRPVAISRGITTAAIVGRIDAGETVADLAADAVNRTRTSYFLMISSSASAITASRS